MAKAPVVTFLNRTGVKLNYKGIGELLKSPEVAAYLMRLGGEVLREAQANAPVATGAYRDGLHLEVEDHKTRTVVRVRGNTDHDWYVEAETGNLARAMDAAKVAR